ncbi:hypothetical protein GCM10017744_000530 [Streptomyces antimycoticus]|uniref:Uncharacterized protein n=1 Tax=Streptomyces antimycoticus TaxID=68175 RepID=A0A4D4KR33_9ACTN|nr:hypothetical protein SANT12839_099120 [Streptomyces antimycoticus]
MNPHGYDAGLAGVRGHAGEAAYTRCRRLGDPILAGGVLGAVPVALAGKYVLLVLDNAATAGQVRPLL